MKKLISALLILTSSLAIAQTTESVTVESNFISQSENFVLPKDPQKRIEYFNTKFLKNHDLKEKTNAFVHSELLESYHQRNEKNQKIRSLFADNIFKSALTDTTLMDSVCIFSFTSINDSTLTAKIFLTYNAVGSQETLLWQELDTITQQMKNTNKNVTFYDQNNRDTLNITYVWNNETNDWTNGEKQIVQYDEQGNTTLSARYQWQSLSQQWIGWFNFIYEYDKNGNIILEEYYTWNEVSNTWQGYSKQAYKYDENNKLMILAQYLWDFNINNWVGSFKNEYEYDDKGNQNSWVNSVWDETKNDWKYQTKWKNTYENNENNFSSSYEYYTWDEYTEKWMGSFKYVYNGNSTNETNTINFVWNKVDEIWEPTEKIVSNYDESELKNKSIHYLATDSIVPGTLINGFNSLADISKIMINPSCPDQTCTTLDSDVTEGDSAISWNYNIVGSFNADSGFCQIQLDNSIDLSDNTGLFLNYKIINPSDAIFIIMLTEASGEIWKFQSLDVYNEVTTEWQQIMIPFSDFFQKINYVDGYLNTDSIIKIEFRLFAPAITKITGSLLLDNFSLYNTKKTNTWVLTSVDEEIHDKNGNLISVNSSRWDSLSQEFIPYFKRKNDVLYNENGQVLQNLTSYWQEFDKDWTNETKQINEYDGFGNLSNSESYSWNLIISNWVGNWKSVTERDEFGNIIFSAGYQWDYETQNWLQYYKQESSFNSTGIRLMDASYNWNFETKTWIGNYKNETILNNNQEVIKTINYIWDFSENEWQVSDTYLSTRNDVIYNKEGLMSSINYTIWDENLSTWSPSEKYYIYYSGHSISTNIKPLESSENELVEVFPNPTSGLIFIRFKNEVPYGSYSLFNSIGQLQKNAFITDKTTTLQVNNLPQGIYILIIYANNTKISKKIILE